jgi:hypothetical protein
LENIGAAPEPSLSSKNPHHEFDGDFLVLENIENAP